MSYNKPWVTWKAEGYARYLRARLRRTSVICDGRRGPIGKPDTERGRAKYLQRRALQGKDRR